MPTFVEILVWLHSVSVAAGGAASFGSLIVGAVMSGAEPQHRPVLGKALVRLSMTGRGALVVLVITGIAILGTKYHWAPPNHWFDAKMAVLVVFVGLVVWAGLNMKKAMAGDKAAAARGPRIGRAATLGFLVILFCAVMAFS
jgi:uncharacterized membrane protein